VKLPKHVCEYLQNFVSSLGDKYDTFKCLCCVLSCVEGCHQAAEKQAYEVMKLQK
jgi:hypothetical protein